MTPFELAEPKTLREAVALLDADDATVRPIAGGTALMLMMKAGVFRPSKLVSLAAVKELVSIDSANGELKIGAMTPLAVLERSDAVRTHAPVITNTLRTLSNIRVRNVATVGGSLAHADAAAELPVCLTALDGTVVVEGREGRRRIPAADLFVTHLTSSLAPDEVLVEARFPLDAPGTGVGFAEVAPRHGDYGLAIVACTLRVRDGAVAAARVAAGAVADRPVLLAGAAAALTGGPLDEERLAAAAEAARAEVEPIDGLHAPAAYRRHLVGVLVRRAARRAWDDAARRAAA
jgi:carbon-monoxide dehydrogenase medium subunit